MYHAQCLEWICETQAQSPVERFTVLETENKLQKLHDILSFLKNVTASMDFIQYI